MSCVYFQLYIISFKYVANFYLKCFETLNFQTFFRKSVTVRGYFKYIQVFHFHTLMTHSLLGVPFKVD
jgi:hypothetical protein